MSLGFIFFLIWVVAAEIASRAPQVYRIPAMVILLALAPLMVLTAWLSGGGVPAVLTALGVFAVFPGLLTGAWRLARQWIAGLRHDDAAA